MVVDKAFIVYEVGVAFADKFFETFWYGDTAEGCHKFITERF